MVALSQHIYFTLSIYNNVNCIFFFFLPGNKKNIYKHSGFEYMSAESAARSVGDYFSLYKKFMQSEFIKVE